MRIGWVDFSREEKNNITTLLKMLGTQGSVDELGIGTIRDYFSNKFFPGITVLQTRAKYFVLIPYIFFDAQKQKYNNKRDVITWINRQEYRLVRTLVNEAPNEGGIIGRRSLMKEQAVKIKPSTIYWNGLRTIGAIKVPECTINYACGIVYMESRKRREISLKAENEDTKGDDKDMHREGRVLFEPINAGYDYLNNSSIHLEEHEAAYIHRLFTTSNQTKTSLMAFFLNNRDEFFDSFRFESINANKLPDKLQHHYELAKQFADFIYGAHALYNVIYARGCDIKDDEINDKFEKWIDEGDYRCDIDTIITESNCTHDTKVFLRRFTKCATERDIAGLEKTVIDREREKKPGRTKLNRKSVYKYDSKARVHDYKLDYRYETAKTIIKDIFDGLEGSHG